MVEIVQMVTCHIHGHIGGHMWSYDLQAHDLDITNELERSLAKEKFFNDCQLAEVNEEILKLNTGKAAQVDNFRPSKKFRQGIVGCSEKTKSCWNEKWS